MKTRSLHYQSGLNLIEILVAALILSVGLLSLAGLQVASLKSVQNATQKQQAAFMVHELLERMRSNRQAALDGEYNVSDMSCTSVPQDCSSTDTSSTTCSTTQIAAYDLYTVQCGDTSGTATRSGINHQLIDGDLTVTCMDGDCNTGVTVTLDWLERLTSDETDPDEADPDIDHAGRTQAFSLSVNASI